jgi:hypothetical protein
MVCLPLYDWRGDIEHVHVIACAEKGSVETGLV